MQNGVSDFDLDKFLARLEQIIEELDKDSLLRKADVLDLLSQISAKTLLSPLSSRITFGPRTALKADEDDGSLRLSSFS